MRQLRDDSRLSILRISGGDMLKTGNSPNHYPPPGLAPSPANYLLTLLVSAPCDRDELTLFWDAGQ